MAFLLPVCVFAILVAFLVGHILGCNCGCCAVLTLEKRKRKLQGKLAALQSRLDRFKEPT